MNEQSWKLSKVHNERGTFDHPWELWRDEDPDNPSVKGGNDDTFMAAFWLEFHVDHVIESESRLTAIRNHLSEAKPEIQADQIHGTYETGRVTVSWEWWERLKELSNG